MPETVHPPFPLLESGAYRDGAIEKEIPIQEVHSPTRTNRKKRKRNSSNNPEERRQVIDVSTGLDNMLRPPDPSSASGSAQSRRSSVSLSDISFPVGVNIR